MGFFGTGVRRLEDHALLTGRGRYVDDIEADDAAHLLIERSPIARGTITSIDVRAARRKASGGGVWTAGDLGELSWPQLLPGPPPRRPLVRDTVRYQGEPVVAVVSDSRHTARDALEEVRVEYSMLPAVVTVEEALAPGAPLVYEGLDSNIGYRSGGEAVEGLFEDADIVVGATLRNHRIAPGMLEGRAILVVPGDGGLTVWSSHQSPFGLRAGLATAFDLDPETIRVVVPEVGGAFGAKSALYPEYLLAVHAALALDRPVKFVESRSENLAVTQHGRGQLTTVELGATDAGTLVGLRFRSVGNLGAAIDSQRWALALTEFMLSGCYRIPRIEREILGVFTNTAPVGTFRGAGRPEAIYALERAIDLLSRKLEIDPAEIRVRNFIDPADFPYETGLRAVYDSGDYRTALDLALEQVGYRHLRSEQARRRDEGIRPYLGVGIASYVELAGSGEEYGEVRLDSSGSVAVRTGTSPHGQGHHTSWAQVAADELGVPLEKVTVVLADTGEVPRGGGTAGSRSAALGGSSVGVAAAGLADRLRRLAAERLEAAFEDLRLVDGLVVVAGTDVGVALGALAEGAGGELREETVFSAPGLTYPFGCHVAVVEVDPETGEVVIVDYVAVDDCGTVINPMLTEAQIHGGVLQGVSHALREEVMYDEDGNLMTANLTTYPLPTLHQAVPMRTYRTETPTPNNPKGMKGVGEAGTTGSTPAVANAVIDALAHLGVDDGILSMPYTPDKVWAALRRVRAT